MSLISTPSKYGNVAVAIHWVSAIAIITLIASGLLVANASEGEMKIWLLRLHIPFGIAVLALTVIRIGWWWFADSRPDALPASRLQTRLSGLIHVLFYVAILGLGLSGVGMLILSDAAPVVFGGSSAGLPDFNAYPPRTAHGVAARLIIALLAIHTLAAVYHQFVKKDGLLQRMWFGAR